jgi:exopolysaccharide production protein ExoY
MTSITISRDPLKRFFDILFSVFILVISSPFMLVFGVLVKMSSPGPVFYGSVRLGQGGRVITCWKFRSMYCDAEKRLLELLASDHRLKAEWESFQKLRRDPRVTPIGRFLRRTSLDEWPQFWNILKGELSVVGPRPCVLIGPPEQFEREILSWYGRSAAAILSVKPGLTGVWQISGRSEVSFAERVQIEEKYARTRTLYLDALVLLKTFPILFFSRGAY